MVDHANNVLIAEARIARQRELVGHLKAQGKDASQARSVLSGMQYSLRLLKRHHQRGQRSGAVPRVARAARDFGSA